jgi:xylulokinase
MTLLLGIDIGTSSAKAVLYDPDLAKVVATAGTEYPILKPAPDRGEQNPDDWWRAAADSVRRALTAAGRTDVAAISLCGQMHGFAPLSREGRPLGNAIIWPDQRSAAEVIALVEPLGADRFTSIAGTMPATGFAGPTLLWLKRHDPAYLPEIGTILFPKDYVRYRLTGDIATDPSDAAASALFDIHGGQWSSVIIESAELPVSIFPAVRDSVAIAGELTREAAEILGLRAGIPVITGCADQPAQAVGNGLIATGIASVTVGSGGQVCTPIDRVERTDPRLHVFNHAVPNMWYILGATLSAGLSLRWLRRITGLEGREDAYPIFSAEASQVPPGANGLIFLPYLTGERTPYMDPLARGGFIGLTSYHERGHLARAVMEGVAFSLRQALEISLSLGGQVERVIAAGGAMDSDVWRGIMADVLGLPLQRSALTELTGVGAALLAGVGAGVYVNLEDARQRAVRYGDITEPDSARSQIYNELYTQFQGLYPTLKQDFHRLSAI